MPSTQNRMFRSRKKLPMPSEEVDQATRGCAIGPNRMHGSPAVGVQMTFPIGRLEEGRMRVEA